MDCYPGFNRLDLAAPAKAMCSKRIVLDPSSSGAALDARFDRRVRRCSYGDYRVERDSLPLEILAYLLVRNSRSARGVEHALEVEPRVLVVSWETPPMAL